MKWWKKALLLTFILLAVVAGAAFVMHENIARTSVNAQIEEARDNQLAMLCGVVIGAVTVIIWVAAYRTRKKPF